jgi:hypothetical protein
MLLGLDEIGEIAGGVHKFLRWDGKGGSTCVGFGLLICRLLTFAASHLLAIV